MPFVKRHPYKGYTVDISDLGENYVATIYLPASRDTVPGLHKRTKADGLRAIEVLAEKVIDKREAKRSKPTPKK